VSQPEIVETWSTVELPILRAIVHAQQTSAGRIWEVAANALPELDKGRFATALFWLYDGGYITADVAKDRWSITVTGAKPKGLRVVGAWPNPESEFARLIALLGERISSAEGVERTKLERVRDSLVDMGESAGAGLITAYLRHYLGI
jgi:hypothetical protein